MMIGQQILRYSFLFFKILEKFASKSARSLKSKIPRKWEEFEQVVIPGKSLGSNRLSGFRKLSTWHFESVVKGVFFGMLRVLSSEDHQV